MKYLLRSQPLWLAIWPSPYPDLCRPALETTGNPECYGFSQAFHVYFWEES